MIMKTAIFKFNNGLGALLCSKCHVIICTYEGMNLSEKIAFKGGKKIGERFCDKCRKKV